jgi:flagellar L-ring protein precursor FlgH
VHLRFANCDLPSVCVIATTVIAALNATHRAEAQNNSLRRRGIVVRSAPAAPTTQPARGAREVLFPPVLGPVPSGAGSEIINPVLLENSLIAFAPPEPRQIRVHDLLTIIVREDKQSQTNAKLESDKTWEIQSALKKWFRIHDDRLIASFPPGDPGVDFDFDSEYEGEGKVKRKDSLITRITASVIDVKPNGTLILEAKKTIEVDEDTQVYTLTGVCRSEDITAQNTVLSTQLADAHIAVRHTGPARDAARRGWLMRLFDWLRPL